ncbi:hypothetical protein STEG23_019794, partial [Scotinomys teguina]
GCDDEVIAFANRRSIQVHPFSYGEENKIAVSMTVYLWQFGRFPREYLNPFFYTFTCLPSTWQKYSVILYRGTDFKFWKLMDHTQTGDMEIIALKLEDTVGRDLSSQDMAAIFCDIIQGVRLNVLEISGSYPDWRHGDNSPKTGRYSQSLGPSVTVSLWQIGDIEQLVLKLERNIEMSSTQQFCALAEGALPKSLW